VDKYSTDNYVKHLERLACQEKLSRRGFLRISGMTAGALVGGSLLAGCGGDDETTTTAAGTETTAAGTETTAATGAAGEAWKPALDVSNQELRTTGLSVTVQDRILADYQAKSGIKSATGTATTYPDAQTRIISAPEGNPEWDVWESIGERLPPVIQTEKIYPLTVASIPNWNAIRPLFTDPPAPLFGGATIADQIWVDKASQEELWMVPTVFNFDSIGYNPDVVTDEEANTWTAIFDEKWKGKSALNTDPLIALPNVFMAMGTLGLVEVTNPGNEPNENIDEAIKWLIDLKKAGQFRSLWGDFGELVNLMASGEVVVADAWQPAVMAIKAQGTPCKYAVPQEGYRAWAIGVCGLTGTPNPEAVLTYADYWLSGPPSIAVSEQGYYSPTTTIQQAFEEAGLADKYAFWYEGAPWVGEPDRGIVEGDTRDGGSLEERTANIGVWHQFPDNYDYVVQKWDEFLTA
jgi:putative spermidine/putrescine transport system substrate-binding protein